MSPFPIIKRFQIKEDVLSCVVARPIPVPAHPLPLELAKEIFRDCIVPAVPPATHTAYDAVLIKHCGEGSTGVLAPLVAMMQQFEPRSYQLDSSLQRLVSQVGICSFRHGPTHHTY